MNRFCVWAVSMFSVCFLNPLGFFILVFTYITANKFLMVNLSLVYEILMYLNSFYFGMFAVCELSIGALKAINLSYPDDMLLRETCLVLGLCLLETLRIILGRKGSLSDRGWQVFASVVLTFPCVCGTLYFLVFQTYILKLEYILCALMLGLQLAELIFGIVYICTLCRPVTYT